ncbi:MAG: ATP-binding protein [Coriobacteriales bacterium]|jgi:predicted AAA+ superfamily ATPase
MAYKRQIVNTIETRINEPRRFIQIVTGPRQTGKTTAVSQAISSFKHPCHNVAAVHNESDADWLRAQWYQARNLITQSSPTALLVIDEVQYVPNWSAIVKSLWDEDSLAGIDLRVLLTGSSATLLHEGLSESLMGRFEIIKSPHWYFQECREAFGCTLDEYLYFGAYPGALSLRDNERRWLSYVNSSIINPSIDIDVRLLGEVRKPELMRRLFEIGAPYSSQEISYRKILGQLDDSGNTSTVARYLELLSQAGLMSGLQKYDQKMLREKASSPRLMVHNTALMTATFGRRRKQLLTDPALHGRLVESAVGAYLINRAFEEGFSVYWWRDGNDEVDFVIAVDEDVTAIEVKSGRVKRTDGMTRFVLENPKARELVIGAVDYPLENFLLGEVDLFR